MRSVIFAVVAFGALISSLPTPAEAQQGGYPFCIIGRDYASPTGDCSYPTYGSCMAAASGRYAYCNANPFFRGEQPAQRRPARRQHRNYDY